MKRSDTDRKIGYYKKTIQLLTLAIEVFFLFFVAAVIFLFVATDDATRFEAENQNLLQKQESLTTQISRLESALYSIYALNTSRISSENITTFFLLYDEPFEMSISLNDTITQLRLGYQRRELFSRIILPLHSRYSQTCYDFALFCDPQEADDIKNYYQEELVSLQELGSSYVILSLGATQRTVMDFRDYINTTGFEEEVQLLREKHTSDEAFIQAVWQIVSSLTAYSREITETPLYPLETLFLGGGDCEDSAILFASMILSAQEDWQVSFLYTDSNNPAFPLAYNHVLVHIQTATDEFYVETTSKDLMQPYEEVSGALLPIV